MRTHILLALLVGLSAGVSAQAGPVAVQHRNECRLAVQTLTTGHPDPKTEWALSIIKRCGDDGAMALASAVRTLRTSTDTATLDYMRYQTGSFRDAEVFAALLDVAGDQAASVPARVYAILALDDITDPHLRYSFKDATTELDDLGRPRCYGRLQMISDHAQISGKPLPSDYEELVDDLRQRIQTDSASPRLVRAATFCTF